MDPGSLSSVCVWNWWDPQLLLLLFLLLAALRWMTLLWPGSLPLCPLTVGLEAMRPTYHGLKLPEQRKTELALVAVLDECHILPLLRILT